MHNSSTLRFISLDMSTWVDDIEIFQYPSLLGHFLSTPRSSPSNLLIYHLCPVKYLHMSTLPPSCRTLMRLSCVTRFMPADNISCGPFRHITVSLMYGFMTTHVRRASSPSFTIDGPPVPSWWKIIQNITNLVLNIICSARII